MNYPLISEYIEAIKSSEDNLNQLNYLRPVLDNNGEPVMSSGNFAVVFKMKDEQTGKYHAVKCFLKEQEGRTEAYRMIAEELEFVNSTYLTTIKYLEKELFVDTNSSDEKEFPVLIMDWIEGITLDKYIRKYLSDKFALSVLTYQFSRMAMWLMPQPFAHGDLKPDNILVQEDGTLVLVDYDGMYVPAMSGQKARETGSPDFCHPARTVSDFDEHIDDFSLICILLSLKAISIKNDIIQDAENENGFLFSKYDYLDISNSKTLKLLFTLPGDTDYYKLIGAFLLCLANQSFSNIPIRLFDIKKTKYNDAKNLPSNKEKIIYKNPREVQDLVKKEKASLEVFPCWDGRTHKDSNIPIWFFTCGDIRGMIAKNSHEEVTAKQWDKLQCIDIKDKQGKWIPVIVKKSQQHYPNLNNCIIDLDNQVDKKSETIHDKWSVKKEEFLSKEEIDMIESTEVVPTDDGTSMCFHLKQGGRVWIPISSESDLRIGDSMDFEKNKILTLTRIGFNDTYRIL